MKPLAKNFIKALADTDNLYESFNMLLQRSVKKDFVFQEKQL